MLWEAHWFGALFRNLGGGHDGDLGYSSVVMELVLLFASSCQI